MPDGSWRQYDYTVETKEPKRGDLGFLWSESSGRIGHVEMYIGAGEVVGAVGGRLRRVRLGVMSKVSEHKNFKGWRKHPGFI
jgi:cell wall-associated NlpC family hydrolase